MNFLEWSLIQRSIAGLKASIKSFGPDIKEKQRRERWVVSSLLKNLNFDFYESDVISSLDDPPDVLFDQARFEIKEILDKGRRRHEEYKLALQKALRAKTFQDLFESYEPKDITLRQLYELCLNEVYKLNLKYPMEVRKNLDLLFYINLQNIGEVTELPFPSTYEMEGSDWRSISFVEGYRCCCFVAKPEAPAFLKRALGKVVHREVL